VAGVLSHHDPGDRDDARGRAGAGHRSGTGPGDPRTEVPFGAGGPAAGSPSGPGAAGPAESATGLRSGHRVPDDVASSGPGAAGSALPGAEQERELTERGVPEELRGMFPGHGVGGLARAMGIRFEELTPQRAVATMPVEPNTQPGGILHGGAHCVLAETLASVAATAHAGAGGYAVGVDINATHQRAVSSGTVTGTCTALHLGSTLTVHEVVVTDEQGRRLSTARVTNFLRER
jgi:1,4-dihydroxy-2-naphthoyl-CoA hydrolase